MTPTPYLLAGEPVVEVFRTNVAAASVAETLVQELLLYFPDCRITFDLEDCDKVLRVEGKEVNPGFVAHLVSTKGIICTVLE